RNIAAPEVGDPDCARTTRPEHNKASSKTSKPIFSISAAAFVEPGMIAPRALVKQRGTEQQNPHGDKQQGVRNVSKGISVVVNHNLGAKAARLRIETGIA